MATILVVDDRADNRAVLIAMLSHRGYRLLEAESGREALAMTRTEKPDLIIADVLMPKMDGYELVQEIRGDPKVANTTVIFYTASYIEEESRKLAEACGVRHVIIKPAEPEQVFKAVDAALDAPQKVKIKMPPPAFDREHLHLVSDKLSQKVEELERLTHEHELILRSAGDGIHGIDLQGNVVFENPKAGQLLGWKPSELIGKRAHETIHHKHADGSPYPVEECPIHASMRDGATRRVSNDVFWRKDGSSFRVGYVAAPLRETDGKIRGSIIVFRDITERVAAEQRLKLQEEQYRLLFQTNPNPMWVFNVETLQILAVNESALVEYGYSREEFLKLTLHHLRPPEEAEKLREAISPAGEAAHYSGEFRHQRKDGSPMDVAIFSSPVIWEGAKARMVTAIDITDRKQSVQRLREQTEIIDRAHDAVIIRDFESDRITFWNSGAENLYGWTKQEALGSSLGDLIFTESSDRAKLVDRLLSSGEYDGEIKHRCKDGREVIVNSRATLIRDEQGRPRTVLGINTDITERKQLETQLLRAQRLESIGTLASGVAHDLNNILTPVLMCSQMLENDVPESKRPTLKLIETSALRGAAIVNQVLTFARGVEGERVLIKPNHLIDEMIDIAKKTFPKNIEISSKYPEDLWTIQGDPTQLHQVLLNLCVNARDAMPNGGALVIWAENINVDQNYAAMMPGATPGAYVAIRVSDTGSGMPRATVEKIFDPFFTTKEVGKGTGLGLSSALGIVKSHSGFISVYSELDKGTTFKIFLPAQIGDEAINRGEMPAELLHGHGELILCVDDEQNILQVTQMILEQKGYKVLTAHDGPEAVAIFAREMNSISAVLTDIGLPFMDGVTLIRSLKKLKPSMPFIASTGQTEHSKAKQLEELGVSALLHKPYDTQKLLETLRSAISSVRS
jgi:two-component system, cell cycle sensor histidine kinase and response regulator CckA